ncbi:MAG: sulfatase [Bacteroides sp.]|nr:sulfatase [Bacteroides sp.]
MKRLTYSLLLSGTLTGTSVMAQDRPNILLFLVDDMGVMDTSVPFLTNNGGEAQRHPLNDWYHTPHMERLAQQGIRFSTFYAQSVSSPSRTSIMTGQNAARHRTTNWINSESNNRTAYGPYEWNWRGLTRDMPVYPRLLQEVGYRTIHVGKAHFGCLGSEGEDPLNLGFDVNIGGCSIGEPGSYYGEWGYGKIKGRTKRAVPGLDQYHGSDTFLTDALTLEAEKAIDKAVEEGKPFYLNMAHYAVHNPFEADKRFINRYKGSGKGDKAEAFATLIEGMDKSLGDLMDHLEEIGVAENTLILFLGDNGGDAPLGGPADYGSSAPLRGKKGSEYEGGVRVPFIAAWAKNNPENKFQKRYPIARQAIQTQMGTVMDLYPTILSVADVNLPKGYPLDGADLKKLLQGASDKSHRDDFLMHFPHGEHRANYFTTYRKGDWKVIYYYNPDTTGKPTWKLYNLKEDPFEQEDVATRYPQKAAELIGLMHQRLKKENALYPLKKNYPETIASGPFKAGHIQGIAVDEEKGHVYYSYTTLLVKTDLQGKVLGTVTGLLGHLGDMDFCKADGRVYASLEYKNDAIGKGILRMENSRRTLDNAFYIAIFDTERINRIGMDAEKDQIMRTVYLPTVLDDYLGQVKMNGKTYPHRHGCSGIDGVSFGPRFGTKEGKQYLTVAYGVYGDVERTDNDYQVLLQYDTKNWKRYEHPLSQELMHTQGPVQPDGQYFVPTGNTNYGVQNLEYDERLGCWWMAVYKGKKPQHPNYSLFAIDALTKPVKQTLEGVPYLKKGYVIPLWKEGWHFGYGSTGLCALDNGLYYLSKPYKNEQGQGSTLQLHSYIGEAPFKPFVNP